jgi:MFS family permease
MSAATPPAKHSTDHLPWLIIAAGSMIAMLTFGPRSAMGFFQLPMLADTGWDRTTFGLAMAIQNLCWGLGQPFFGALADKFGTWRMLALSGLFYSSGLFIMAYANAPIWLHVGGGVLVGLGVASGSFGIVLSAFARNVAPHHRSFVFGIGTAAGSAGMFLFAPLSQGLISAYGWSDSLVYLGFLMLLVPLFALPLRGNAMSGRHSEALSKQTVGEAIKEALGHRSYLLLVSGFFVCGYHRFAVGRFHQPTLFEAVFPCVDLPGSLGCRSGVPASAPVADLCGHLRDRYGPVVAVDRSADQRAGSDHVRHAAPRSARRHRFPLAPGRFFPRRLDGRLSL